jgi:aspartate racemase
MLGILGGMGPLASAELLKTIYRLNIPGPEQEAPRCVLLSDPSFPDRTEAILSGSTGHLAERLTAALEELARRGAERIVIACVTAHHVLPDVPEPLRRKVISLLDLVVDELTAARQPHLLLASTGTRRSRIFERHERWSTVAGQVHVLDEDDQHRLHEWIYRLKQNAPPEDCLAWLDTLPSRYGIDSFLFACTELHLLQEPLARRARLAETAFHVIDPLFSVARDIRKLV